MKIDKKKLVFGSVVIVILLFIGIYAFMLFGEDSSNEDQLEQTSVPLLEEDQKEYKSRMEAVDALREKKPRNAPSIYNEDLIDAEGNFDPYLEEKERQDRMDSILASGPAVEDYYGEPGQRPSDMMMSATQPKLTAAVPVAKLTIGNGHLAFFHQTPSNHKQVEQTYELIYAVVHGDQVVRKDERLEIRLTQDVIIAGDSLPKNTLLYATCSFKANRLLLQILPSGKLNTPLQAFDIADGQKGIYIENSFRSQASKEVLGDVIQDINISGVPQVSGLKSIFQRSNRRVKVKVLNQYQLILKPSL